ncbi:MAG TPA: c-type cytochrome [Steroidobacteraceae bacterium]|nr:c-type cytochrome [Steroidobacteraceae bacterium]
MSSASNDHSSHEKHDKHFYDSFLVVLGILVVVALVLIFLSRIIANATQTQYVQNDAKLRVATEERLAPVGKVAVTGADNSALETPKEAKAAPAKDMTGEEVFNMYCTACHTAGVGGAPKFGDKAAWAPRIAQGMPTLFEHALKGFQGKAQLPMPMKGNATSLPDKSITNAVEYMVKAAK